MNMVIQFLVPGMEDLDDPGLGAKIFLICAQFQKCFCAALMEQAVKEPLIAIDQGIEFMGKSKHYMEVRGIYDFRPALIDPDFFKDSPGSWDSSGSGRNSCGIPCARIPRTC